MLELLKSLWDRAVSEGGVVSGAPMLFGGAVLFLTVLASLGIWQMMDWRYSGVIANRDATIGARDSQIGLLGEQIKGLEARANQLKEAVPSAPRSPDAISQLGNDVGLAIGAQPDLGNGKYYFRAINANGDFNKGAHFKFRGLKLKLESASAEAYAGFAGEARRQFTDVVCSVASE